MKKAIRIKKNILVPTLFLIGIAVFFSAASGGRFLNMKNMKSIIDQSVVIIIGGLGTIFTVAIGGVELSNSGTMAIACLAGGVLAQHLGAEAPSFLLIVLIATAIGLVNGLIIAKLHVGSFLTTISMLMILRGLFTYIQTFVGLYSNIRNGIIDRLYEPYIEIPALVILVLFTHYIMEYTTFGKYSKAIGENENMALNMGLPVDRIRILAFTVSGMAAGVAGVFMMSKLGGVTNAFADNYHMDVMMALFLGGILVTGGVSTNVFKLILGAVTLIVLKNGLIMIGLTQTAWSESIRGLAMMVILFVTMKSGEGYIKLKSKTQRNESLESAE